MDHSMCGSGASWCARTDRIFDVEGMHVLAASVVDEQLVLDVETDQVLAGCPSCGVVAVGHSAQVEVPGGDVHSIERSQSLLTSRAQARFVQ